MKSLLIKSHLSRRRDVFVFPPAPIVINFAMFFLKNAPFRLERAELLHFPLFHCKEEMLQVLCQVISYPP